VREKGVLTLAKIEQRPRTFSNFQTQGKLRQLLEHLMRCALRMPRADARFFRAVSREGTKVQPNSGISMIVRGFCNGQAIREVFLMKQQRVPPVFAMASSRMVSE
jgi:hypothetical protein